MAPRIDTPLPPTDNASPIGPVGTMMHIKLACCDITQLQSQLHRSITREVYIVQGQCVHNDVPMCMWGGGGGGGLSGNLPLKSLKPCWIIFQLTCLWCMCLYVHGVHCQTGPMHCTYTVYIRVYMSMVNA